VEIVFPANRCYIYSIGIQKGGVNINNLRSLRKERKRTGPDVAEYLNISIGFYYGLENGSKTLSQEYLERLSDYYGVSIDYLLGRTTTAKLNPELENTVKEIIKTDHDLFQGMCQAKDLPPEDREKIKEYTAILIEKQKKK
jgi:transcriptional regulator with XRE-family HTH domain